MPKLDSLGQKLIEGDKDQAQAIRDAVSKLNFWVKCAEAQGLTVLLRHGDTGYNGISGKLYVASIARHERTDL